MVPVQVAIVLRTCLRSADPTNRTLKVSAKDFKETMAVIKYSTVSAVILYGNYGSRSLIKIIKCAVECEKRT